MQKNSFRLAAVILFVLIISAANTVVASAEDDDIDIGTSGSGGGCQYTGYTAEEVENNPPVCTGVTTLYGSPQELNGGSNCYYNILGGWNCDTATWEWEANLYDDGYGGDGVVRACPSSGTAYQGCEINEWTGKLTCAFWDYELSVSASFPCATLDIEPYPATMVRWPTKLRFSGANSSSKSASLDYKGTGTEDHPNHGDRRDITLRITLQPEMNYMQVYLPHAGLFQGDGKRCFEMGSFTIPLQNSTSPPATTICWNVASHPEVGANEKAGSIDGMGELPADFPMFSGWTRTPYMATWHMSYEEWSVVDRECLSGPNGNGRYQCKTQPGLPDKDGHWHNIYGWKQKSESGIIDPAQVTNLPDYRKADLNGDGIPDAYWSYGAEVRRMNEAWQINDPVYGKSWACRTPLYFGVREGQSQSIYLNP